MSEVIVLQEVLAGLRWQFLFLSGHLWTSSACSEVGWCQRPYLRPWARYREWPCGAPSTARTAREWSNFQDDRTAKTSSLPPSRKALNDAKCCYSYRPTCGGESASGFGRAIINWQHLSFHARTQLCEQFVVLHAVVKLASYRCFLQFLFEESFDFARR